MNRLLVWVVFACVLIGIVAIFIPYLTIPETTYSDSPSTLETIIEGKHYILTQGSQKYEFDLVDPEDAPDPIRTHVIHGFNIMNETKTYAPNYAGDAITCTNCHFAAGNTLGGANNGISLVGASTWYPSYSKRDQRVITLQDRIRNCFERSLNGKPPTDNAPEMIALIAYLDWISHNVKGIKQMPWRGLVPLTSKHTPEKGNGAAYYQKYCSMCHGYEGEGIEENPPLWGANAFNDGAGMNGLDKMSTFIYLNMPYTRAPFLSEEQSLDVAAFIISQPRPTFKK